MGCECQSVLVIVVGHMFCYTRLRIKGLRRPQASAQPQLQVLSISVSAFAGKRIDVERLLFIFFLCDAFV